MRPLQLTNYYLDTSEKLGNYLRQSMLIKGLEWFSKAGHVGNTVSLLRGRLCVYCADEIPGRFSSSSLPPSFAPGRFAAFLSSGG
jgi:hypothetical protein